MAKKKTYKKSHSRPTSAAQATAAPTIEGGMVGNVDVPKPVPAPAVVTAVGTGRNAPTLVRDFGYVGRDLRAIGVMGGGLLLLEIVLWYLFGHTALGPSVYNLVNP